MCIAGINATTLPCQHRWADLIQPCHASRNLQNCPNKLSFSGWEQKHATCPWCSPDAPSAHDSTHRLFGGTTCPISPRDDTTSDLPDLPFPRRQRTNSTSASSSLSRHSSVHSIESEWAEKGQRHRDQNERLAVYLTSLPHEVLPSARKYYPTYSASSGSEEGSSASEGGGGGRRESGRLGAGKRWTRRMGFGRGMWKG